ncbi:MAG: hypothetical protein WAQ75_12930 [Propionicimonas sp.]
MSAAPGRQLSCDYTIRVAGRLDARWTDWFDGFSLTCEPDGTTTIAGVVADQAQLHGLLAKIRDLGVPLISLEEGWPSDRPGYDQAEAPRFRPR